MRQAGAACGWENVGGRGRVAAARQLVAIVAIMTAAATRRRRLPPPPLLPSAQSTALKAKPALLHLAPIFLSFRGGVLPVLLDIPAVSPVPAWIALWNKLFGGLSVMNSLGKFIAVDSALSDRINRTR